MKLSKKLLALITALVLSFAFTVNAFAYEFPSGARTRWTRIDSNYGVSAEIWGNGTGNSVTSGWTTNPMVQGAYVGRNQTADPNCSTRMTILCSSSSTTWTGCSQTLPGYGGPDILEISGYTVSKGHSSTKHQLTLTLNTGVLYMSDAWVKRPATRAIQQASAVWSSIPVDELQYAN